MCGSSGSPPFSPVDKNHAECAREESSFYEIPQIYQALENSQNLSWISVDSGYYSYGSENDIAYFVKNFLLSFLIPLGIQVNMCTELGIMGIRSDILILTKNSLLIGVVEVKKPGKNILIDKNVMGDLFDQMKLLQLFYGMGPVLGILATGGSLKMMEYSLLNPLEKLEKLQLSLT
jgi:hypothetical protein